MDKKPSTKLFETGPAPDSKATPAGEARKEPSETQNPGNSSVTKPEPAASGQVNGTNSPLQATNAGAYQPAAAAQNSEPGRPLEHDALIAATRKIHERSWQSVGPLLEELQQKTWHLMDTAAGAFTGEIEQRVTYQTAMALENFDIEANARLTANLDRALARMVECQREAEQSFRLLVSDSQKEMNQSSSRVMQDLQQRETAVDGNFQKQAREAFDELKRTAHEVTSEVRQIGEALTAELGTRTDQMIRKFESRLQVIVEEAAVEARERVSELARDAAQLVEKQTKAVVDRQISGVFISALRNRLGQLERAFADGQDETGESQTTSDSDGGLSGKPRPASARPAERTPGTTRGAAAEDAPANAIHLVAKDEATASRDVPAATGEEVYARMQPRLRQRFASLYGNDRVFAEYEPAYRFGCKLASNPKYAGKDWRVIEKEIKQDWENQGGGQWEKFKGSIQYAWLDAFTPE
jgi:hypothetical protein